MDWPKQRCFVRPRDAYVCMYISTSRHGLTNTCFCVFAYICCIFMICAEVLYSLAVAVQCCERFCPPFITKEKASGKNHFLIPACIKHIQDSIKEGYIFDEPMLVAKSKYKNCTIDTISHYEFLRVRVGISIVTPSTLQISARVCRIRLLWWKCLASLLYGRMPITSETTSNQILMLLKVGTSRMGPSLSVHTVSSQRYLLVL